LRTNKQTHTKTCPSRYFAIASAGEVITIDFYNDVMFVDKCIKWTMLAIATGVRSNVAKGCIAANVPLISFPSHGVWTSI